jgi:hypothetical protein
VLGVFAEDRTAVERQAWVNTSAEALLYLQRHPEIEAQLVQQQMQSAQERELVVS